MLFQKANAMNSRNRCAVRGCVVNKAECPHIPLHSPTWTSSSQHQQQLQEWEIFCNQQDWYQFPKRFAICNLHFDEGSYENCKLKRGAVPTLGGPAVAAVEHLRSGE